MILDLKLSSDWDGWAPPDTSTMQVKFTNVDKIPTVGSNPDPDELRSVIAEAD